MLALLEANGHQINATDPELADWIIQLSGDFTPEQLAERIAQRLIPATPRCAVTAGRHETMDPVRRQVQRCEDFARTDCAVRQSCASDALNQ